MLLQDDVSDAEADGDASNKQVEFNEVEASSMLQEYRIALNREMTAVKLPMLQAAN